ncbi:MAG TPA: signal peptide peptidase SppA [Thermoanaerobaculia bacterium]|nr:signal peptide peptidase SppA [Thermoanaerobaculia bacterium]
MTEPIVTPPRPAEAGPARQSRVPSFFFGVFSGCFVGILIFSFIAALISATRTQTRSSGDFFSPNKVAVLPVEGEIIEARDFLDQLHRYADTSSVKAIVIRLNTPGGAVVPSQEMYEEIRKVKSRTHKPIVASLDSVAASGGFYVASACDEIVSNPGSVTGSIGVILQWINVKDLVTWAKMKPETIYSGTMKDAGDPMKDLTDAERAYLQRMTDQLHAQFIRAVAEGRKGKMTEADVARIADGRVFVGEEALQLKLVDQIGNLDDAVNVAARLAGIHGRPGVIYPRKHRPNLLDLLSNTEDSESLVDRVLSRRGATFLYRW